MSTKVHYLQGLDTTDKVALNIITPRILNNSQNTRNLRECDQQLIKTTLKADYNHVWTQIECELRAEAAVLRKRLARKDSDVRGLLEVLRRLREFDYCTIDGIHFNEITRSDIFGSGLW